ncbi:MAG TPA: hypothetical protein ENG50_04215, partial [Candidatus Altiarchaeales archaeon]|nr:hypothetical protein [Candidatus Altiarchaeales archaeon]
MRVCIVSHLHKPGIKEGGGGVSTYTFAKAFRERGHEVIIVSEPEEIDKRSDVVWHQNIKNIERTVRICKKFSLPLIATVNSNVTCCTGAHITNESKYGTPCTSCSFIGAFKCLLLNKRNQNRSGSLELHMRKLSFVATPLYF